MWERLLAGRQCGGPGSVCPADLQELAARHFQPPPAHGAADRESQAQTRSLAGGARSGGASQVQHAGTALHSGVALTQAGFLQGMEREVFGPEALEAPRRPTPAEAGVTWKAASRIEAAPRPGLGAASRPSRCSSASRLGSAACRRKRLAALLVCIEDRRCWARPASVLSRYVLLRPLTWSDELASALLSLARHAGRRHRLAFGGEHMRLTLLLGAVAGQLANGARYARPSRRRRHVSCCSFMVSGSRSNRADEAFILRRRSAFPNSLRAAAIPAGCGLMALLAVEAASCRRANPRQIAAGRVAVALAVALLLWLGAARCWKRFGNRPNFAVLLPAGWSPPPSAIGVPIAFAFPASPPSPILSFMTGAPLTVVVSRDGRGPHVEHHSPLGAALSSFSASSSI